ncbi:FadD7 family fatty acid--CoA ligase [Streptomyces sp. NPDC091292]|uniref:FadD7 family fatty acid--CoA ligase n=1 Tax=Streptomyces sp. NPDC091292 TaxID=3365991 RepID=UPI0038045D3C
MAASPSAMASAGAAVPYRPPEVTGLTDLIERSVKDRPGSAALIVRGDDPGDAPNASANTHANAGAHAGAGDRVRLSYAVLDGLADDLAARLADTGLRPGDPVGLIGANTVEFVAALLGAARAGLVTAPLDPALPGPEIASRLTGLGVRALLAGPAAPAAPPETPVPTWPLRVRVAPAGTATVRLDTGEQAASRGGRGAAGDLTAHDALVLFTAGTTGRAKMVPLTHTNVAAGATGVCATYELGTADGTVAVMPFFHGHGLLAGLLASLASGGRVVLPPHGRFSAHTFWDDMEAADATWFTAVPTIHQILLARAEQEYPGRHARPLRFVRSCSAPLPTATGQALEDLLGAPVLSAYGMTESTHQATGEPLPHHGPRKRGSVGPATGVDLRIVGTDGRACPPGAEGEVWVSGPAVARGYLGNPAETAHSFVDGRFRTGDLGRLDTDGCLFLTGRIKDLINRGGEKISPEHVEDVLAACPGVAEAAVFPVPDATYGQVVGAAVVVREDASGASGGRILSYCRTRLAPFEVPERLQVVAALPHTAKGALDRRALASRYGA